MSEWATSRPQLRFSWRDLILFGRLCLAMRRFMQGIAFAQKSEDAEADRMFKDAFDRLNAVVHRSPDVVLAPGIQSALDPVAVDTEPALVPPRESADGVPAA